MFIKQFYDEGLAHLSYLIGDGDQALVIDPHLDVDDYLDLAHEKKLNITHIFETHRNEDYVIGSQNLAKLTGAQIYHGTGLDFKYGNFVREGETFIINQILIKIIETPGHTPESISLILYDQTSNIDLPVAVFTGDALFVGAVGRTDLWKTRSEAAGILYESIYHKILPLGDQTLLYPAHGAGSVCGEGLSSRNFSTLGFEKSANAELQNKTKEEFIQLQSEKTFEIPPYFKEMERRNQNGPDILIRLPYVNLLSIDEINENNCLLVDVRSPEAYASVALPGSISLPTAMIAKFAGWFLNYDDEIVLIADNENMLEGAVRNLVRLGFNKFRGWIAGVHAWETSGKPYWHIPVVHASKIKTRLEEKEDFILLDVRSDKEWNKEHLPRAQHIYLVELIKNLKKIPKDKLITTICSSGQRANIAASILKMHGFNRVEVCFGSLLACKEVGCPIEA